MILCIQHLNISHDDNAPKTLDSKSEREKVIGELTAHSSEKESSGVIFSIDKTSSISIKCESDPFTWVYVDAVGNNSCITALSFNKKQQHRYF